jgi:hypothetical protein
MRRRITIGATLAGVLLGGAMTAEASELAVEFGTRKPARTTSLNLFIRYTQPDDPQAKPPAIRHLEIDFPAGTRFHSDRVAACKASDADAMARGPAACPAASRIGGGPIRVITGFGPPFDPFDSPTPTFNDGNGWLEISQDPSKSVTVAVTRATVSGSRLTEDVAAVPGGPPDWMSAVSTVDLTFPEDTGYVTTPPTCRGGGWVTSAKFEFGDGTTQYARDTTPCRKRRAARKRKRRP